MNMHILLWIYLEKGPLLLYFLRSVSENSHAACRIRTYWEKNNKISCTQITSNYNHNLTKCYIYSFTAVALTTVCKLMCRVAYFLIIMDNYFDICMGHFLGHPVNTACCPIDEMVGKLPLSWRDFAIKQNASQLGLLLQSCSRTYTMFLFWWCSKSACTCRVSKVRNTEWVVWWAFHQRGCHLLQSAHRYISFDAATSLIPTQRWLTNAQCVSSSSWYHCY